MSEYDDLVDEYYAGSEGADIRVVSRAFHLFDFVGYPIRLFQGVGTAITPDGERWFGTVDSDGVDHLEVADFNDGRDGSSQLVEFGFPYIDLETYNALKTERWRIVGQKITRFVGVFLPGEGLRPSTPIDYDAHFYMQGSQFREWVDTAGSTYVRHHPVTVTAKNGNAGRSQAPRGTYTPAGQRDRAFQMYGITGDKGCDFIPELANKTFTRP